MASGGSDQYAEYALSKLFQMGTVAEYESEFVIHANRVTGIFANLLKSFYIFELKLELQRELFRSRPTTLGEAFSFARIAEACFEDERSTIAIAKPKELTTHVHVQYLEQTTQGRGDKPNHILLVTIHHMIYPITMEVLNQIFSPHGGVDESETLGPETFAKEVVYKGNGFALIFLVGYDTGSEVVTGLPEEFQNAKEAGPETFAKEVVYKGNGSALIFLVGYDTGSEVVTSLPEEFQEGDVVDALSRVLEQKISEKGVDSCSRRQDYTLFGASLFTFLNPGLVIFLVE
ncbi:polypyrimidine tract-binding protein homolog 3 [Tanacetum coccineum]